MKIANFTRLLMLALFPLCACAGPTSAPSGNGSEPTGSVVAYLSGVPKSVLCVTLTATTTGGTFNASQAVADTSQDVEIALGPLPFGAATVSASAYPSTCGTSGAVATWRSDPLAVTINASNVTDLDLVLRPYRATGVDVSFKPIVSDFTMSYDVTLVVFPDHTVQLFGNDYYTSGLVMRTDVSRVFISNRIYCETTTSGALYCAGDNTDGGLGIGNASNSTFTTPQLLSITNNAKVSVNGKNGCAISIWGDLYCWGDNGFSQITSGTTDQRSPFYEGNNYRDVAVGADYLCWVWDSGYVSCHGNNVNGQLGNGTTTGTAGTNILTGVTQLASSGATTYALMGDGTVKAWGIGNNGDLGNGTSTTVASTPVAVSTVTNVVQVAATNSGACSLAANGDVYCWGGNLSGQVGNGKTANQTSPVKVLSGAKRLATTGNSGMCALLASADLMCWGNNNSGQLGDGTQNSAFVPMPVTAW